MFSATDAGVVAARTFSFRINENGVIGNGQTCDQVGDEFNPLTEVNKYGQVNPYQDPARGRIADITTDANGDYAEADTDYDSLMQNLSGKDSIIGRSITLTNEDTGASQCCVIARDVIPEAF